MNCAGMKTRGGLRSSKVQKVANRSEEQQLRAKTRARKLYDNFLTKFSCVVMDDETYCKADFKQLPGQEFYVAAGRGQAPEANKTQKLSKFPKKYLIWQALCSCGLKSKPFVTTGSVNTEIYLKECLQKRLLPFLELHDTPPLFWPDLATCHYSKRCIEFYTENSINIVPKIANPPNCPELCPIEKYWAEIKQKLKKTKGTTTDIVSFRRKYKKAADSFSIDDVQVLMKGIKQKVKKFYSPS